VPAGKAVSVTDLPSNTEPELIGVTHNETSTGVQQPLQDLRKLRKKFPKALITVDVVSSFPVVELPFEYVDSFYFSVQKCFGLPAGLGGWLVNQRFIEKARQLAPTGKTSYHGLDSFLAKHQKYQTPATPNVLYIYLLGQVIGDMLEKGLDRIRMESKYKSAILYHLLEAKRSATPFVTDKDWRSETVIVGDTGENTQKIIDALAQKGLIVGNGYGSFRNQHIRIANFPTHSKEQVEMLVDKIGELVI
jgi:phosphoserine aminotransferase